MGAFLQRELKAGTTIQVNGYPVQLDADVLASSSSWDEIDAPLPQSVSESHGSAENWTSLSSGSTPQGDRL